MLKETLQSFGLNPKEISVYLATLELGKARVSEISRKSGIERTLCYSILGKLENLGLVKEVSTGPRKLFLAEPPENIVLRQKERLQKVQELLPELKSIYNLSPRKPQIRFYEGKEGLLAIFAEINETLQKGDIHCHCGPHYEKMWQLFGPREIMKIIRGRVAKGAFSRIITNKTPFIEKLISKNREHKREFRFIAKHEIPARIHIFGPKIALMSLDELMGVVIEDQAIANLMRLIFSALWEKLSK